MLCMSFVPQEPSHVIATIGEVFAKGGFMMWPISGCSVLLVGLTIERLLSMRQRRVIPRAVALAVEQIRQGRADAVEPQILESMAPAARVLAAGLRRRGYPLGDIERGMSDQVAREGALLRSNVRGVTLMAAVGPLCGLLGTVIGIARAFAAVEGVGQNRAEMLASGIGVALYTTIFGLSVAIPATLIGAWLQGKVRRLMLAIDTAVSPAIEHLAPAPKPPVPGEAEATHAA
jgi:biopolymer transport protein ExbB